MQGLHQVAQKSRMTILSLKSIRVASDFSKFMILLKVSAGDFFPSFDSCAKALKVKSKIMITVKCLIFSI